MPAQIVTPFSPDGMRTPRQKPKPPGPKHDRLCLGFLDERGKPLGLGLRYCWCMCVRCWLSLGRTPAGHPTGRCICPACPCRRDRFW
jgi:hypothetical protein